MKRKIKNEADYWDELLLNESIDVFENDLDKSDKFTAVRPPKVNVTLRLDPTDLSLLKRKSHKLGIPHSQVIASIVHQALRKDKTLVNH